MSFRKLLLAFKRFGTILAILGELAARLKEDELRSNLDLSSPPEDKGR